MLEAAGARLGDDQRVRILAGDLAEPIGALGDADVIVSGFAIHHLDHDRKRSLFGEVTSLLRPGGLFANLEVVQCATDALQAAFYEAIGRPAGDPEDRLVDVETQLGWMRAAGLTEVHCMWRWRGFALLCGSA